MVPSLPLLSCESPVFVKENPDRKKKKKISLSISISMSVESTIWTWSIEFWLITFHDSGWVWLFQVVQHCLAYARLLFFFDYAIYISFITSSLSFDWCYLIWVYLIWVASLRWHSCIGFWHRVLRFWISDLR